MITLSLMTWGVGEGMFLYFEPLYLQELGADPILIGSILGSLGVAMAISYLPAGFLSDRFGRQPLLRLAWIIGLAATWLMALAKTLPVFVIGMAAYSFTTFVNVPLNSYVTQARGNLTVGRVITLVSASFNLGVIIGPLIGGWIGNQHGLKQTFLVAALIFILSTTLIFFIRPQPIEKDKLEQNQSRSIGVLNKRYFQFLAIAFIVTFALYLPQPFSQNFLQNERGINLTQIGQLISIRSFGLVVFNLVLGQLNARFGYLLSQIFMGLFTLLMWQGTSFPWYMTAYFMLGSYITSRSLAVAQIRTIIHTARMGVGYGLLETASASAIILAAPIAGYLYHRNPVSIYPISLVLIGIVFVITIFRSPIRSKDLETYHQ